MSDVMVFPDIEKAILKYLLTVPEVTAAVSQKVWAELIPEAPYPCATVRKLSSRNPQLRWQETAVMEVAGYEHRDVVGGRATARLVCETVVASLNAMRNVVTEGCVIAGPLATTGPRSVPDQISPGVANHRFIAEVTLMYHPL
jgi:hypothetical protein